MGTERYNRQLILQGFGEAAQHRLAEARVLVIGAGGLGCPALQYLAAAGIGHIGIADHDTVSLSNLHRQILYGNDDMGHLKVEIAVKRLHQLNPDITLISHPLSVNTSNILNIIKPYDYVFDATDNFTSRYLINDACVLLKTTLIFAAVSGYEGQLAIFNAGERLEDRTNYRDLFPVSPEPGEIANCAEEGVLGVLPGIIGTMAAAEIIKLITGIGDPLINKIRHYHLLSGQQYEMNISPASNYTLADTEQEFLYMHTPSPAEQTQDYLEIDATQLQELQQQASTLLIDVRERHEFPTLDAAHYRKIPMSEFSEFLQSDVNETNIVLLCQHGIRSQAAAEALFQKYGHTKNIFSLKGGIVKWRNHFKDGQ